MISDINRSLKSHMNEGEIAVGMFLGFPASAMIRYAGDAGFDFVIIDTEHGPLDVESMEAMIIAAEAIGIVPVVRVPSNDQVAIMRALDLGARGIQVPQINGGDDARRVIQYSKFAPIGSRGLALSVWANRFDVSAVDEFIKQANEETLIVVHIENINGLENLSDILAVEEIDVIFVGPVDLSHSLGIAGQFGNKEFLRAMDKVITQGRAAGKILGTYVGRPEDGRKWIDRGVQYVCTGAPGLIRKAYKGFISGVKGAG